MVDLSHEGDPWGNRNFLIEERLMARFLDSECVSKLQIIMSEKNG